MNIKTKQSGFTIVELLIVVVVIAILAAITLVSFNNITNRANDSSAKETASNVQKKIELYNAENSAYPTTFDQLVKGNNSWTISPATMIQTADPSNTNGKNTVKIETCNSGQGFRITYWEYNKSPAAGLTAITIGNLGSPVSCAALTPAT